MIKKKHFLFGSLSGLAFIIIILTILSQPIFSAFFEYGTENTTSFRIDDRTGKIVSSDRYWASYIRLTENENIHIGISNYSTYVFTAVEDAPTSNFTNSIKDQNLNDIPFLFSEKGGNYLYGFYLKFNGTNICTTCGAGSIKQVLLYLAADPSYIGKGNVNITAFRVFAPAAGIPSWNETNITYNNQPCGANPILSNSVNCGVTTPSCTGQVCTQSAPATAAAVPGDISSGIWITLDITSFADFGAFYLDRNMSIFVLANTSGSIFIHRRENPRFAPKLVIITEGIFRRDAKLIIERVNSSPVCIFYDNGNLTCLGNLNVNESIGPSQILDVDDEDVETDLNTYVDIAGDNMEGSLLAPEINITFSLKVGDQEGGVTFFNASNEAEDQYRILTNKIAKIGFGADSHSLDNAKEILTVIGDVKILGNFSVNQSINSSAINLHQGNLTIVNGSRTYNFYIDETGALIIGRKT